MKEDSQNRNRSEAIQELQLVNDMLQKTKQTVVDRGAFFLLWGGIVFFACSLVFALSKLGHESSEWLPWAILLPVGAILSMFLQRKYAKQTLRTTYIEHSYDSVWLACGIAFGILSFTNSIVSIIPPRADYPIVSFFVGIGLFASGGILEWTSLKIGGAVMWGGAVIMMLVPAQYHPLIMAIIIIPGYIVPGYLLKRQFSDDNMDATL